MISKGAEAVITQNKNLVTKERIKKGYRIPELDETLRKRRTAMEAKLLREARRAGVATPRILEESKFSIKMDFISGEKLRDAVNGKNAEEIGAKIGTAVAKLHTYHIVHGDLTTSNMILKDGELFLIDFGLGFISQREEDKANDLYLLREVLESTHFEISEKMWNSAITAYKAGYEGSEKVLKALSEVEKRGRYKERPAKQS